MLNFLGPLETLPPSLFYSVEKSVFETNLISLSDTQVLIFL